MGNGESGFGAEDWGVGIGQPEAVSGQPIAGTGGSGIGTRDWGLGNGESGLENGDWGWGIGIGIFKCFSPAYE